MRWLGVLVLTIPLAAQFPALRLEPLMTGLRAPVQVTHAGDG